MNLHLNSRTAMFLIDHSGGIIKSYLFLQYFSGGIIKFHIGIQSCNVGAISSADSHYFSVFQRFANR